MAEDPYRAQVEALGQFIHAQRKLAGLSLRELSAVSEISNAYLSQLERGLHEPSLRVLNSLSEALGVSTETLLKQAGVVGEQPTESTGSDAPEGSDQSAEEAIMADPGLTDEQKQALLAVYRGFTEGA